MKNKIITTAFVAGLVAFTSIGRTAEEITIQYEAQQTTIGASEFVRNITTEEWKSIYDNILSIASTNVHNAQSKFKLVWQEGLQKFPATDSIRTEYDTKLANVGLKATRLIMYDTLPKLTTNALNEFTNFPTLKTIIPKYGTCLNLEKVATLPEFVNGYAEVYVNGLYYYVGSGRLEAWKKVVLNRAQKELKRAMRKQGKSFVSIDGKTNPFQDEIDALTTALNAPKFSGLKEWFAKWYPSYQWRDIQYKTNEELQKLQDDIFYGDRKFGPIEKCILQIHLGVDECNNFIKRYNGDQN